MALAKYRHVLTTSTSNGLANTESNIFKEDIYSSYTNKNSGNGITYSSSTGEFTVDADGTYFVFVTVRSSLTSAVSFDQLEIKVKLDGNVVDGGDFLFAPQIVSHEDTLQSLVTATSGQKITVTLRDPTSSDHGLKVEKFTSIIILKAEDGFGKISRTSSSTGTTDPFNVYATASGGATVSQFSAGGEYSEDGGAGTGLLKINEAGPALMFATNFLDGAGGSPNVTIDFKIDDFTVNTYTTRKPSTGEPRELSVLTAYGFEANTSASVIGDSVSAVFNCFATSGSSITAFKLPSSGSYVNNLTWQTIKSDGNQISSDTEYNILASASYSDNGYSVFGYNTGSTFTTSSGAITLNRAGDYAIFSNLYFSVAADTNVMYKVKRNSSIADQLEFRIDSASDPEERTVVTVVTGASSGDTLQFFASGATNNILSETGTSIVVMELFALPPPPIPPPDPLISKDFTLNTYSIETLTAQYDTTGVEQVPFMLGGLGPLRLRGRTVAQVVKNGDKKN